MIINSITLKSELNSVAKFQEGKVMVHKSFTPSYQHDFDE